MKKRWFNLMTATAIMAMTAPLAMAGAGVAPAPAVVRAHGQQAVAQHRLSAEQMYRDYMETGSIYYSDSGTSGPPIKRVTVPNQHLLQSLQSIETEAAKMAHPHPPQARATAQ